MIDGIKIKNVRKQKGLSQVDLARDITTQGTISSLERNSTSPGSDILVKILNRLDLKLNDVVINDLETENDLVLTEADHFSMSYKYKDVIKALKKFQNTDDKDQQAHYQFLKVDAEMWITNNFDDAIFGFNQLLLLHEGLPDIFTILATCELGVAYSQKNDIGKANFYFEQTASLFKDFNTDNDLFWSLLIYDNLGMYYANNDKFEQCISSTTTGLNLAKKNGSVYFVGSFYYLLSEVAEQQNRHSEAIQYMIQAYSFTKFMENHLVEKKALAFLKKNNIDYLDF
ncbi:XRE family transcriptional regulator [Companilactobacillus suantsaicola]|uniref:XRE family transcriptional regulator n=1 Tax=Companilactobacillus suantsaicola TaxID=2487723 RepID=A0A4Z0JHK9_9LACO|nr:helix-turn-helix transcriptional regulator [Companilactobacillus suantsaicola]TGD21493.1 XRE family transcriptional regulator [Companilactobacillus suantsaicola]